MSDPFPSLNLVAAVPKQFDSLLPVLNRLCRTGLRLSLFQRISQLHHWFKSYGNFAKQVDFVYWWSCIGKSLRADCKAGIVFPIVLNGVFSDGWVGKKIISCISTPNNKNRQEL